MGRVLVIHCTEKGKLPLAQLNKEETLAKLTELLKANPGISTTGAFTNDDGVGICDWEAPSADKVKEIVDALGAPYDAIVEVKQVFRQGRNFMSRGIFQS